ncbi:TrbI/VirB10 family protein [Erythrobacter sp. YT30]|uniref:TrbI/VirB10 family protein n=1 Tax=Erythrobacter sp. YT30 TaxID=1735012 RepID=UPI00076BE470|nr:TrbI/VirB10 family protein [Erythrobacter sp. YT30]KWV90870.1 type VI secretion protein [Erythrobacter sp. YT30]
MRLAKRFPSKNGGNTADRSGVDPRDQESAEIIDLASRSAFPAVTERKAGGDKWGPALGVAIVGLLGATTFWAMNAAQQGANEATGVNQTQPPQTAVPATAPVVVKPEPVEAPVRPAPVPAPVYSRDPNAAVGPAANPYASPNLIADFTGASPTAPLVQAAPAPASTTAAPSAAGGSAGEFASRIGGVGGGPAQASQEINPATTVTKGTLIPAILETAINTDVPGYVRAVVSQDVRSFDGTKVLIPRSSRLVGQYQSGVQNGQKRAYVIWTDLITPKGASIQISSPAVAFDGTTGLAGDVDNHFFRRFGSGLLLSLIGAAGTIASGGAGIVVAGGQNAASTAVQQDGNIPPTIKVQMGEPVRVFAARNLDFSTVSN